MNKRFEICSKYKPSGDQPKAIQQLTEGLIKGYDTQTLLGILVLGKPIQLQMLLSKYNVKHLLLHIIKLLPHSYTMNLKSYSLIMLLNILFLTTITINQKHIFLVVTHI